MSDRAPEGIYVYQPFGMQHPDKWKSGRIYGIGGLPMEATCHGFTKPEAEAIVAALRPLPETPQPNDSGDAAGLFHNRVHPASGKLIAATPNTALVHAVRQA